MENHVALAAEKNREDRSSTSARDWALDVAMMVNNDYEIGLTNGGLTNLAETIRRHAVRGLIRSGETDHPVTHGRTPPDALAALQMAEKSISEHNADRKLPENQNKTCDWDFGEGFGGTIDVIRAAIAKATGAA